MKNVKVRQFYALINQLDVAFLVRLLKSRRGNDNITVDNPLNHVFISHHSPIIIMNKAVSIESLHRVQDARHFSNPTRNERSECRVGYAAGARGCVSETHYYHQRWTSSTATRIVACIQHACPRIAPATPHCAPLRSACMGLLRFRAYGTVRKKITKQ